MPENPTLQYNIVVDSSAAVAAFETLSRSLAQLGRQEGLLAQRFSLGPQASAGLIQLQQQARKTAAVFESLAAGGGATGSLGNAIAGLNGQMVGLSQTFGPLNEYMARFRGNVMGISTSLLGMTAGLLSVGAAMSMVLGAFRRGSELLNLSRSTGQSVSDLVTLQKALEKVNIPAESLRFYLFMLNRALGTAGAGARGLGRDLAKMGLDAQQLSRMSAKEQLVALGEGLKRLSGIAEQTAAMRRLFGRSGPQLLAALKDEGFLREIQGPSRAYAMLMERNAKLFESIDVGLKAIRNRLSEVAAAFAESIGPMLNQVLAGFKTFDGTEAASKFVVIADALKLVISYINVGVSAVARIIGLFGQHAAIAGVVVKSMVALGMAYAALGISRLLQGLAGKLAAFTRNSLAVKAETAAMQENTVATELNTAAQIRNAAARGAGMVARAAAMPAGPPLPGRQELLMAGGQWAVYPAPAAPAAPAPFASPNAAVTAAQLAAANTSGRLAEALSRTGAQAGASAGAMTGLTAATRSFSAASIAAAANWAVFVGALGSSVIINWISQLQSATAALEDLNERTTEFYRRLREERGAPLRTVEERDTRLKTLQADLRQFEKDVQSAERELERYARGGPFGMLRRELTGQGPQALEEAMRRGFQILEAGEGAAKRVFAVDPVHVDRFKVVASTLSDAQKAAAAARKEIAQLKSVPTESLIGGGGFEDMVRLWRAASGANKTMKELFDPQNAAELMQHLQKIAGELDSFTEKKYSLYIELATDPTEKLRFIRAQTEQMMKEIAEGLAPPEELGEMAPRSARLMAEAKEFVGSRVSPTVENIAALQAMAEVHKREADAIGEKIEAGKRYIEQARNSKTANQEDIDRQLLNNAELSKLFSTHLMLQHMLAAAAAVLAKQKEAELKTLRAIASTESQRVEMQAKLLGLQAQAADNRALAVEIERQQELNRLTAEYVKLLSENASIELAGVDTTQARRRIDELTAAFAKMPEEEFARRFPGLTPAAAARATVAAEVETEAKFGGEQAKARLARERLDTELAILQAKREGRTADAIELERRQRINDLAREYEELLLNSAEIQKRISDLTVEELGGPAAAEVATPAQRQAARARAVEKIRPELVGRARAEAETRVAAEAAADTRADRERLETELKILEARARGNDAEAERLKRSQRVREEAEKILQILLSQEDAQKRINALTEANRKKMGETEARKAAVETVRKLKEPEATEAAERKVDLERAQQRERTATELQIQRLKLAGEGEVARLLEKQLRFEEKRRDLLDQGFKPEQAEEMARDFIEIEEAFKNMRPPAILSDEFRRIGGTVQLRRAPGGAASYRALGQPPPGYGMEYYGVRTAAAAGAAELIGAKAGETIGEKGAKAVGIAIPLTKEQALLHRIAVATAKTAENTGRPKPSDPPNKGKTIH